MDRREAMLRELNLYPQWVLRNQPVPDAVEQLAPKAGNPLSGEPNVELTPPIAADVSLGIPAPTLVAATREAAASGLPSVKPSRIVALDWPGLKQQVRDCTACKLRAGCTQTVFGVGDEKADWLFVGEGPGADEDALGEPFVGQAGKLLDNMLMAIKLKRGKNVYIANIVKCRPPGNRNPEADEVATCLPYLERQIELIQPKLIVALGKVASNALLGKDATLASLRGKLHDYRGISLLVTYHPAYLLRTPSEKAKAWQDLLLAVRTMEDRNQIIPLS
jgi:DNA polymerase